MFCLCVWVLQNFEKTEKNAFSISGQDMPTDIRVLKDVWTRTKIVQSTLYKAGAFI